MFTFSVVSVWNLSIAIETYTVALRGDCDIIPSTMYIDQRKFNVFFFIITSE